MKVTMLFVSVLAAFVAAHGPDDDGDEMPKMVTPKATPPAAAAPKAPLTAPKSKPSGFTFGGFPKAGAAGFPKIPAAAIPKAPTGYGLPKAAGAAPVDHAHAHGGM